MSTTILTVLAAVAVVVVLVVRRSRPRPLAEEALRKPLVLSAVGLVLLRDVPLDATNVAFLLLTAVVAFGLGAARGRLVRLQHRGAQILTSWGPGCFAALAALVGLRLGLDAGAHLAGVSSGAVGQSVLLALGLSLLAESLVVAARTGRRDLVLR